MMCSSCYTITSSSKNSIEIPLNISCIEEVGYSMQENSYYMIYWDEDAFEYDGYADYTYVEIPDECIKQLRKDLKKSAKSTSIKLSMEKHWSIIEEHKEIDGGENLTYHLRRN